jgi:tetratricopeptide (TPR) repeat protein
MNPLFDNRIRRMIPRWRDAATTASLGELGSLTSQPRQISSAALHEKLEDWKSAPSLFVATDIVGTAVLSEPFDDPTIHDAANAILDAGSGASGIARRAAEYVLHGPSTAPDASPALVTQAELYARLHQTRKALWNDSRNAVKWVELSQLYTLGGQLEKARATMRVALRLAPDNRYVLRSATRLFVHMKDPGEAWSVLRNAGRTAHDPWLVAAEIGVAGLLGQSPKLTKAAIALASSGSFRAHDLTEMASSLGTLEAEHGNRRKAKKLFELAMRDPNDNVLAQAAWAARDAAIAPDFDPASLHVPLSFEARARLHFQQHEWTNALRESEQWFNDQRFSVGAAAFASYISAVVLAEHEKAVALLKEARIANPDDWLIRNNLAFSLASLNRVAEASDVFEGLSPDSSNATRHGVWLATSGLLAFRRGNIQEGQRLYDQAIEWFQRHGLTSARVVAAVFKAREELNAELPSALQAVHVARDLAGKAHSVEFDTLVAQLEPRKAQRDQLKLIS